MANVISIHSFRGGTGKSNSTANIAAQLARAGNRVAVVDTDIQSPGIHVLFGFSEDALGLTLNDYLYGNCSIAEAAHDVTSQLDGPEGPPAAGAALWLVPSSIKAGDIAKVLREGYDAGVLNDGFRELSESLELDYLLIDTHPGLNEETLLSITVSDTLVLLMRPDRQDIQGTAVTVDVARRLGVPELLLLVNMVPSSVDRGALGPDLAAAYGVEVAGLLPLSETVVENSSSALFSVVSPDEEWSRVIAGVAARIAQAPSQS